MNELNTKWIAGEIEEILDETMEDRVAGMARFRQEHLAALIDTRQKHSWKTTTDLKVGYEVLTWVEHRKNKLMERWV